MVSLTVKYPFFTTSHCDRKWLFGVLSTTVVCRQTIWENHLEKYAFLKINIVSETETHWRI